MRMNYNPQSKLRRGFEVWLLFSKLQPIVLATVARVSPSRFGAYRPTVAHSLLPVSRAVPITCPVVLKDLLAIMGMGLARYLT